MVIKKYPIFFKGQDYTVTLEDSRFHDEHSLKLKIYEGCKRRWDHPVYTGRYAYSYTDAEIIDYVAIVKDAFCQYLQQKERDQKNAENLKAFLNLNEIDEKEVSVNHD